MAKFIVTRSFICNSETHTLDCVSTSPHGSLSISIDLTTSNFVVKSNSLPFRVFHREIGIFYSMFDSIY